VVRLGFDSMKKQKKNNSRRKVRPSPKTNTREKTVYIPPLSENASQRPTITVVITTSRDFNPNKVLQTA